MTQRKYPSKTEATNAYDKAIADFTMTYIGEVANYFESIRLVVTTATANDDTPTAANLFRALDLHLPEERHIGLEGAKCQTCAQEINDTTVRNRFPCGTFIYLAAALGLAEPPAMGDKPVFKDFWIDPYVTVTFEVDADAQAVHESEPRTYPAGAQATLKLVEAIRVQDSLVASSALRVEALS